MWIDNVRVDRQLRIWQELLLLLDLQRSGDWALWSYEDRELELKEYCCVSLCFLLFKAF